MAPEQFTKLFTYKNEITNHQLRNISNSLCVPQPRTDNMKTTFMYDGAHLWNSIPNEVREYKTSAANNFYNLAVTVTKKKQNSPVNNNIHPVKYLFYSSLCK